MTTNAMHADHPTTPTAHDAAEPHTQGPRVVTIREAAELCDLSRDAIRGRVERGSLRSVLGRDGLRRVPVSELERAGLLDHGSDHADDATVAAVGGTTSSVAAVAGFLDALERLQAENVAAVARAVAAETRLQIEQQAASSVELELHEARAELEHLRGQLDQAQQQPRRRWFGVRRH